MDMVSSFSDLLQVLAGDDQGFSFFQTGVIETTSLEGSRVSKQRTYGDIQDFGRNLLWKNERPCGDDTGELQSRLPQQSHANITTEDAG